VRCAAPLEAPSAFESERFLCGEENRAEFEALLDACHADHSANASGCQGVLSMRGDIDSQAVVLDASVSRINYGINHVLGTIPTRFVVYFEAPYFTGRLDMQPESTEEGPVAGGLSSSTYLNLEARGGNYLSSVEQPSYAFELQTLDEVRGSLSGELGRGGFIETCFHLFPPSPR